MSKLFKLFGFLESSKRMNTQGIGLGLYICKKIVEEFGGTIEVKSKHNEGSEFSFTFMLSEI
jgi:signal transduction histidine kinase